jgi:hypothetical protein
MATTLSPATPTHQVFPKTWTGGWGRFQRSQLLQDVVAAVAGRASGAGRAFGAAESWDSRRRKSGESMRAF